MHAEILTIGDELCRGEIVDTNSSYLAQRLWDLDITTRWMTSCCDDAQDIITALQQAVARADVVPDPGRLLDVRIAGGSMSEAGLRANIRVGVQYLTSWLNGTGAAAIANLMEDVATAEISRAQVWQWVQHGVRLSDGRVVDRTLVQAIAATGKPYVVVLMNGRPLTIGWLADHAPALLESWFPGTEGGNAVADVLFGKVNPGGKLPMSFPRNVGQIPISYNELPTGRPYDPSNKYTSKYLDVLNTPQYPFGFGLSYTTFALSNLHLSASSIGRAGTVTATASITNTGTRPGDDVVQLYIHDQVASILQPVRRLDGFRRVTLMPGQTQTVTFKLGPASLGFYNNQGQFLVEPGGFDVYVGDSSVGGLHASLTVH